MDGGKLRLGSSSLLMEVSIWGFPEFEAGVVTVQPRLWIHIL
jgi:hypothetical protein